MPTKKLNKTKEIIDRIFKDSETVYGLKEFENIDLEDVLIGRGLTGIYQPAPYSRVSLHLKCLRRIQDAPSRHIITSINSQGNRGKDKNTTGISFWLSICSAACVPSIPAPRLISIRIKSTGSVFSRMT